MSGRVPRITRCLTAHGSPMRFAFRLNQQPASHGSGAKPGLAPKRNAMKHFLPCFNVAEVVKTFVDRTQFPKLLTSSATGKCFTAFDQTANGISRNDSCLPRTKILPDDKVLASRQLGLVMQKVSHCDIDEVIPVKVTHFDGPVLVGRRFDLSPLKLAWRGLF